MKRESEVRDMMKARAARRREERLAQPAQRAGRVPAKKGAGSYKRAEKHRGRGEW